VLVNLAATPGLGSLMARRVVAGTGQLLLAVVGFCLIVGWMFELFHRVYLQQMDEPVSSNGPGWMGQWGLVCFGAGWLWSLVTSLSLLRQVKADEPAVQKPVPPRLADLAGKPPEQS
jgi:hypothetical protein